MKKLIHKLHLWLGLASAVVVFIVSITGAIYCFQKEITDAMQPWRKVAAQNAPFAAPSVLVDSALYYIPGGSPSGMTYDGKTEAAGVGVMTDKGFNLVLLNPYDGSFIKRNEPQGEQFNFFRFVMNGHRSLWLPRHIGRPIVGVSVLIFVFLLLSGLVLWYPKRWTKSSKKASFRIKWMAKFKRLNRDLHNVLGFYVCAFALVLALTGLVISFNWFADGVYFVTSGGKSKPVYVAVQSDTTQARANVEVAPSPIDMAFFQSLAQQPKPDRIFLFPTLKNEQQAISIFFYEGKDRFYNRNSYYYDQHSLAPIRVAGDRFEESAFADKLQLMNYDLHTGAALGIWGKIIAFITSLIIASLPVTGFIIWWKKRPKTTPSSDKPYAVPR
ncbi:MAG: PepSY-associated TM helix domain-containing protein [Mangrovibacterium sp.]